MQHKSLLIAMTLFSLGVNQVFAQTTTRVNVTATTVANQTSGTQTVQLSSGGKFVLFDSFANNLDARTTNLKFNLYLKNRLSGTIERINVSTADFIADNNVGFATMSSETNLSNPSTSDVRFVVFDSTATNLVSGDTNGTSDVFLRDRTASTTTRISLNNSAVQGNSASTQPYISANGRYVAYQSLADNLVGNDTNGVQDVFRYDRVKGTVVRASVAGNGSQANSSSSVRGISQDGRYVLFLSASTNLVNGNATGSVDVFLRDMTLGKTTRVSATAAGNQGTEIRSFASMSPDARYVTFQSGPATFTNFSTQVYLKDRYEDTLEVISRSTGGTLGDNPSTASSVSAGGRYVTFVSQATNLISNDSNAKFDIFVRDRTRNTTERVSVATDGTQGNNDSAFPSVSADGRSAAFVSGATNLISGDTNTYPDIFVRSFNRTENAADFVHFLRYQNPNSGAVIYQRLQGMTLYDSGFIWGGGDPAWKYKASPDLNGDGIPDAVLQYSDGMPSAWIMGEGGTTRAQVAYLTLNGANITATPYRIMTTVDLNGDGKDDLILQDPATRAVIYWLMNGVTITQQGTLYTGTPKNWNVVAAADMNGDGMPDLILQNADSRSVLRWTLTYNPANAVSVAIIAAIDISNGSLPDWTLKSVVSLSVDDSVAFVFQNDVSGDLATWRLVNGVTQSRAVLFGSKNGGWNLFSALPGDFSDTFTLFEQNKVEATVLYVQASLGLVSDLGYANRRVFVPWQLVFTGK